MKKLSGWLEFICYIKKTTEHKGQISHEENHICLLL